MVMEASRAEYLAEDKFKQHLGPRESSTSRAEPSSSAASESFIHTRCFITNYWKPSTTLHSLCKKLMNV